MKSIRITDICNIRGSVEDLISFGDELGKLGYDTSSCGDRLHNSKSIKGITLNTGSEDSILNGQLDASIYVVSDKSYFDEQKHFRELKVHDYHLPEDYNVAMALMTRNYYIIKQETIPEYEIY